MATPTPEQTIAAYQAASGRTRAQLLAYASSLWLGQRAYRDTNIDGFVAGVVPRVLAGQLAIANLTSVFLAAVATRRGKPTLPVPVDARMVQQGRGVPPADVYRRPAIELYSALKEGATFEQARKLGTERLESLVSTDLQMAKVRQADASLQTAGAQFFRRVLKGEKNCAKCIITSTRRYRTSALLPIHPGCDCDIDEIDEDAPPLVLDKKLLLDTHEQVKQFANIANDSAEGYQDLIVTHEHGEIGPVLSWRGQKFTGPAEIH